MVGDSKTAGFGSIPGRFGYGGLNCLESPARFATGGWDTKDVSDGIDAALAARTEVPDYILINIGVNNAPYLGTPINASEEATIKASYSYALAALAVKYPGVPCYCAYPWMRGYDAACDTLAGWIDFIISQNPNAHPGIDERIILKGSDDGATWTGDGVHPRDPEGYQWVAKKWLQLLGRL